MNTVEADAYAILDRLLAAHRDALLADRPRVPGPCAGAERLEHATRALADALLALQPKTPHARPPIDAAQCIALRASLDANRVAVNRLKASNDRALESLFGEREPATYRPLA